MANTEVTMFEAEFQKFESIAQENQRLKTELATAKERLSLLDDLARMLEAHRNGEVPVPAKPKTPFKADGSYSPALAKDLRRAAIEAYVVDGNKHLSQTNATIGKKFGLSKTRTADIVGDLVRSGKIPPRPKGRPARLLSATDPRVQ